MLSAGGAGTTIEGVSMERVRPVKNLQEFFRSSVEEAMHRQQLHADDHTAYYVVNLLTLFARSEALFDETEMGVELKPLARVMSDAVDSEQAPEMNYALQRVGDVSLFVAGFLGEGLHARFVGVDYYVRMGGSAYSTLATNVRGSIRGRVFADVFAELAEKFQDFVDVLADIRDEACSSQADILRLYETWQKTGSRRAARILRARGIEPSQAGSGDVRH
jgi:hypothetical protein